MADLFKRIRGTISTIFQLGLGGPQLKNNSGAIEAKNAADNAYAVGRGATPVADNDWVTKKYADTLEKPIIVKRQADCTSAIPNNTAVRGFVVVSTAGTGAAIGDVLYDNGLNTGVMEILAAIEGRCIAVTDALAGGTVSFDPDSIYVWDADATVWVKIGDIGSVTGAVRCVRYVVTNAATQDSTSLVPANARVLSTRFEVTTPYSGGGTVSIGRAGSTALLMATTENVPQTAAAYVVDDDIAWGGSPLAVRTTVGGAPAAGAGIVVVLYSSPNA